MLIAYSVYISLTPIVLLRNYKLLHFRNFTQVDAMSVERLELLTQWQNSGK